MSGDPVLPIGDQGVITRPDRGSHFEVVAGTANAKLTIRPIGPGSENGAGSMYRLYTESDNIALHGPSSPRKSLAVTVHDERDGKATTASYQVIRIARNTVGESAATVSQSVDPSACVKNEVYGEFKSPRQESGAYTTMHFRSVDGMVEFLGRMLRVPLHLRPLNFDISSTDAGTGRFSVEYQVRE